MGSLQDQAKALGVQRESYLLEFEEQGREPEGFVAPFQIRDWGVQAYEGEAPDIKWLIKDVLPQGTASLIASMGGVGKSYLILATAIAIASRPSTLSGRFALGGEVVDHGPVVVVSAEDSHTAIHRRISQITTPEQRKNLKDNLFIIPLPDAGGSVTLMRHRNGEYEMTETWHWLCREVAKIPGLKLLALDPLQVFVQADITSDPAAAQVWWSAVSALCAATGACVLAAHHMRKDGGLSIETLLQAREAIRGTTGLVDGARWVYALWMATVEEREKASAALDEALGAMTMIKGGVCKSNEFGSDKITIYIRDESGLLKDRTDEVADCLELYAALSDEQIREIFLEIVRRWEERDPFSPHYNGKDRYLGNWIAMQYGIDKDTAKDYVDGWLSKRNLVKETHPARKGAMALRRRETP